jgi:hypothetical protein
MPLCPTPLITNNLTSITANNPNNQYNQLNNYAPCIALYDPQKSLTGAGGRLAKKEVYRAIMSERGVCVDKGVSHQVGEG